LLRPSTTARGAFDDRFVIDVRKSSAIIVRGTGRGASGHVKSHRSAGNAVCHAGPQRKPL
jgi:hypothetical protein